MAAEVTVADDPGAARYEITVDGERAGFVTYRESPGVITFLHAETYLHGVGAAVVGG